MAEPLTLSVTIAPKSVVGEPKADLTAFQAAMAESIKKMARELSVEWLHSLPERTKLTADKFAWPLGGDSRRGGKSAALDMIYGIKAVPAIPDGIAVLKTRTGSIDTFNHLYMQDWSNLPSPKPDTSIAKYESDEHPSATVRVFKETMDARDPLNPNPSAKGGIVTYVVKCGEKKLGSYHAATIAKLQAKTFHDRLCKGLEDREHRIKLEKQRKNPNFGRF